MDAIRFPLAAASPRVHIMPLVLHAFPIGRARHVKCHQEAVQGFSLSPTTCSSGTQTKSREWNSGVEKHCGTVAPRVSPLERANICPVGLSLGRNAGRRGFWRDAYIIAGHAAQQLLRHESGKGGSPLPLLLPPFLFLLIQRCASPSLSADGRKLWQSRNVALPQSYAMCFRTAW